MATNKLSPWEQMTPAQRVAAVNIDIMNHVDFSTLAGIVMMGEVRFKDGMPTAGTDGQHVYYGTEFINTLSRKQLRFVQLHESLHKALRHCLDYKDIVKKYPQLSNVAMDYVVNAFIEQTDPKHQFMEFTTDPEPLLDRKYFDRSFVDVLQDLLKNMPPPPPKGGKGKPEDGDGEGDSESGEGDDEADGCQGEDGDSGMPQPLDQHIPGKQEKGSDAAKELDKEIEDALNHGDMVQKRIAGKSGGGNKLSGLGVKRDTDWRNALREWIQEATKGDEFSRFCPPNKRMLPLGVLMPSHFDVATGELGILCDTSGSMEGIYPIVFGEIASIAQQANPERVRLIWWDTQVRGEQVFERGSYDQIATQLKPLGGGGTTPQCVARYLEEKTYSLKGVIWLSDGWLDACPTRVCNNELWGIVNNSHFQPAHGKVVRITC